MLNNLNMSSPVQVYALGGLGEVGKNTYCVEDENNLIMIDAGVMFPEESILGVNYVIPDYTHLKNVRSKIKALFITHGHEDHIGGIPFLLQNVFVPFIYAPKLAAALIKNKLEEHNIREKVKIIEYDESSVINIADTYKVQFFHVTHSIPDAYGICIDTPQGRICTTGDFKIDLTPIGPDINLSKIARLGEEGVDLLLSDSTNAEKEGFTLSETTVINSINEIFSKAAGRLIISTFSSNVSRVQQIVQASLLHKRKLVILGRSMESTIDMARKYGYIHIPDNAIIGPEHLKTLRPEESVILCTGSQGEPMAALSRIANGEHRFLKVMPGDTVVFSSSPIPGNTASVNRVVNQLTRVGANVITNSIFSNLHTSGHPAKQELRLMLKLFKPKYFMPVHGEFRMLRLHAELAISLGIKKDHTFVLGNGDTLILKKGEVTEGRRIPTDDIYIDGKDISGLSTAVIRDRNILANDGMVAILVSMDSRTNSILLTPKIISSGFVFNDESSKRLLDEAALKVKDELTTLLHGKVTFGEIKNTIRSTLSQFLYIKTRRNPMIIPLIMNKIEKA